MAGVASYPGTGAPRFLGAGRPERMSRTFDRWLGTSLLRKTMTFS